MIYISIQKRKRQISIFDLDIFIRRLRCCVFLNNRFWKLQFRKIQIIESAIQIFKTSKIFDSRQILNTQIRQIQSDYLIQIFHSYLSVSIHITIVHHVSSKIGIRKHILTKSTVKAKLHNHCLISSLHRKIKFIHNLLFPLLRSENTIF